MQEKYVGDIVTSDGKHSKNIAARRSKGIGIISEIMFILDGLCLGSHYFAFGMTLRLAMLQSVILFNSETWLRLTQGDIKKIEGVDEIFLRKLLHAPRSTPKAALYLEAGCIPMSYHIKVKRIMFLHHILTRNDDQLILRFYQVQKNKAIKGDWCLVVKEDLKSIGLEHLTDDDIKVMKADALKKIVKEKILERAFTNLKISKRKMKKLDSLSYDKLSMQAYLKPESNLSKDDKYMMFRWRTKMIKVKSNIGIKDSVCPLCKSNEDTQEHLLNCETLDSTRCGEFLRDLRSALRVREIEGEKKNSTSILEDTVVEGNVLDAPAEEERVEKTVSSTIPYEEEEVGSECLETTTETIPYDDKDAEEFISKWVSKPKEKVQPNVSEESKISSIPIRRSTRHRTTKMKSTHDHLGGKLVMIPVNKMS